MAAVDIRHHGKCSAADAFEEQRGIALLLGEADDGSQLIARIDLACDDAKLPFPQRFQVVAHRWSRLMQAGLDNHK